MLTQCGKSGVPFVKATTFNSLFHNFRGTITCASFQPIIHNQLFTPSMPTQYLSHEVPVQHDAGTGHGKRSGPAKSFWERKHGPIIHPTHLSEAKRIRIGPITPTFPDGVPFQMIRHHNQSYMSHRGHRWTYRYSLKRGRKKLLK